MKQKRFYGLLFAFITAIKLLVPYANELPERWGWKLFGKGNLTELAEVLCRRAVGIENGDIISASESGDGEQSGA